MRTKCLAALMAAILLLFTGCQGESLPSGMDEDQVVASGIQVVRLVVAGDYDGVHALLRQDQRETCTPEDFQALALQELEDAGVYKEVEDSMATGQSAGGEDFAVANLYCKFSKKDVLFRVSFDQNMAFIGISIHRQ